MQVMPNNVLSVDRLLHYIAEQNESKKLMAPRYITTNARTTLLKLKAVPIEQREQWDHFVIASVYGHLLQSWGWGELKALAGWSPLRLALWDGEQIVAAAQVLRRTASHLPLWAGHLAYIPKGPVIDWSQPLLCDDLFSQLNTQLRRRGALALRVELPQEAGTVSGEAVKERMVSLGFHPALAIQ